MFLKIVPFTCLRFYTHIFSNLENAHPLTYVAITKETTSEKSNVLVAKTLRVYLLCMKEEKNHYS